MAQKKVKKPTPKAVAKPAPAPAKKPPADFLGQLISPTEPVSVGKKSIVAPKFLQHLSEIEAHHPNINRRVYIPFIDIWLYGGISHGNMISLIGDPGTGKSTLVYRTLSGLLRTCRQCLTPALKFTKEGGKTVYTCKCGKKDFMTGVLVDSEHRADEAYLNVQGIETGDFSVYSDKGVSILLNPTHASERNGQLTVMRYQYVEAMFDYLGDIVKEGHIDFVAIDSLNATASQTAIQDYKRDLGQMARANSYGFRNLQTAVNIATSKFNKKITVLWTNHLQEKIGGFSRPGMIPTKQAGGRAPQYYQTQCIKIKKSEINPKTLTKVEPTKLDHAYVREYSFQVLKTVSGTPDNYSGDYSIWLDNYVLPAATYAPGDTGEDQKLFQMCAKVGLYFKDKTKYNLLGFSANRAGDLAGLLTQEALQYEARYWIAKIILPEIGSKYLEESDYIYGPYVDKERIARVRSLVEEKRRLVQDGVD